MIPWIASTFLVLSFIVLVRRFKLVENSRIVITVARRSLSVIRSTDLNDDAKEVALQSDAKVLFKLFFLLSFGGAAAVLVPVGFLWLSDRFGLISTASVLAVTLSPTFIVISVLVTIFTMYSFSKSTTNTSGFSLMERILYRLSFRTHISQISLADIEDRLLSKQLSQIRIDRPVFITALPRAGTTLLLECLANTKEFASHTYRDMPFVLIPYLWSSISASFRKTAELRERAHGDGLLINFDSHEALEEVLWKTFWKQYYLSDRIDLWGDDENSEFNEFFFNHMRKIILLRSGEDAPSARYVSKNNLNIARISMLHLLFPDSAILVPFRQPLHHSASLLEQHRNFLRIHKEDPFASEYMREIGHYDFGENLRPVNFNGWLDTQKSRDTDSLAFWLEYWIASYSYMLTENAEFLHFLSYDALCEEPEHGLQYVADVIESSDTDELISAASRIHSIRTRKVNTGEISASLLQEAERIYTLLEELALKNQSQ